MNLFELLFIILFLLTVGILIFVLSLVCRGQRKRAVAVLRRWGIGAALYFGCVAAAGMTSTRRVLPPAAPQCFDDWCVTIMGADRSQAGDGTRYDVNIRLWSRAKRVSQRENGLLVYLLDTQGQKFLPVERASDVAYNVLLGPGESVMASRLFTVPAGHDIVGAVVQHKGWFPGCCIIGETSDVFGKSAIVKLQ